MLRIIPLESSRQTAFPRPAKPQKQDSVRGLLLVGLMVFFFIRFMGNSGDVLNLNHIFTIMRTISVVLMVAAGVLIYINVSNTASLAPPAAEPVYTQAQLEHVLAQQAMYYQQRQVLLDRAQKAAALSLAESASIAVEKVPIPNARTDVESEPAAASNAAVPATADTSDDQKNTPVENIVHAVVDSVVDAVVNPTPTVPVASIINTDSAVKAALDALISSAASE